MPLFIFFWNIALVFALGSAIRVRVRDFDPVDPARLYARAVIWNAMTSPLARSI